ncbi:hypothetical protein K431DRAFT_283683 [Polychaeton citri CBS 116435]|uniref:Peroxin 20 n=1 Tax=Polychaeton citri CBS 116435 TaxID=1314669 RepID=A0A9P4QAL0_9PEZI|nr:hypothetical protein K431DRAFT_283683 [Polychaeton citri CBS 116435]
MSDAVCGPSNPLQQFKQQTQLDRSLQQDRLSTRHSPASQGFRSQNPNAGLLDPEFEAFQAGIPTAPEAHHFQPFQPQHAAQFPSGNQAPSWATDFQRMSISSPPPHLQQQQQPHHFGQDGRASSATPNWAYDFRSQLQSTPPQQQHQFSSPSPFQYQPPQFGFTGFQSQVSQQPRFATDSTISKGKERAAEQFDDEAFARAFDLAAENIPEEAKMGGVPDEGIALQDAVQREQQLQQEQLENEEVDARVIEEHENAVIERFRELDRRLDQMPHEEQQAEQKPQHSLEDDDALAATAQELLQKVEHNQTDKFRNSQFLGLMRKLADREVKVEGDKMVETGNTSSRLSPESASEHISASSFASQTQHRFDNSEQRPAPLTDMQPPDPILSPSRSTQTATAIPYGEQDHDASRYQPNPEDGQAVVDLLNQPSHTQDIGA